MADATGIELKEKEKVVITTKGNFTAKAVIIAAGTSGANWESREKRSSPAKVSPIAPPVTPPSSGTSR